MKDYYCIPNKEIDLYFKIEVLEKWIDRNFPGLDINEYATELKISLYDDNKFLKVFNKIANRYESEDKTENDFHALVHALLELADMRSSRREYYTRSEKIVEGKRIDDILVFNDKKKAVVHEYKIVDHKVAATTKESTVVNEVKKAMKQILVNRYLSLVVKELDRDSSVLVRGVSVHRKEGKWQVECKSIIMSLNEAESSLGWAEKKIDFFLNEALKDYRPYKDIIQVGTDLSGNGLILSNTKPVEMQIEYNQESEKTYLAEHFTKYHGNGLRNMIALRLRGLGVDKKLEVSGAVMIHSVGNIVESVLRGIEMGRERIILPLNVEGKHWLGIVVEHQEEEIKIGYIDSENGLIREEIKEVAEILSTATDKKVEVAQIEVDTQQYGNCGPEFVENVVKYLGYNRASQEAAVPVHSLLLENTLLDPVEYAAKIEDNKQLIFILSNQSPYAIDRPIATRSIEAIEGSAQDDITFSSMMVLRRNVDIKESRTIYTEQSYPGSSIFRGLFNKFLNRLDISWQYKKFLYAQEVRQFQKILKTYGIDQSIDVLKNNGEFKKSVLFKLHTDKSGRDEDFTFATHLKDKFSAELDMKRLMDEKIQQVQPYLYKTGVGLKILDVAVDAMKLIKAPTAENTKKIIFDSAYFYGIYKGVNSYSIFVSSIEVSYQVYKGEYDIALRQIATTAFYMAIPAMIGYANIPILGFLCGVGVTGYTGYNVFSNLYSLYQAYVSEKSELKYVYNFEDKLNNDTTMLSSEVLFLKKQAIKLTIDGQMYTNYVEMREIGNSSTAHGCCYDDFNDREEILAHLTMSDDGSIEAMESF